jgi:endoglucanase
LQSYFKSPFFPNNMPAVWQQHFAFAQEKTGRPIVIGEFGGDYTGADRVWQDWAIPYMIQQGFGLFYFARRRGRELARAASSAVTAENRR